MTTRWNYSVGCVLPVLLAFGVFGCSTLGLVNYPEVQNKADKLIADAQYGDARAFLAKYESNDTKWCFEYYENGNCRIATEKNPVPELLQKVQHAENCDRELKEAESEKLTKDDADRLISQIETNCKATTAWKNGHPTPAAKVRDSLKERRDSLPYAVRASSDLAENLAKQQNTCQSGMKWGFYAIGEIPKNI